MSFYVKIRLISKRKHEEAPNLGVFFGMPLNSLDTLNASQVCLFSGFFGDGQQVSNGNYAFIFTNKKLCSTN